MNSAVLIISDDPEVARTITARWQGDGLLPAVTLISAELFHRDSCHVRLGEDADTRAFELAIVDSVSASILPSILSELLRSRKMVLLLTTEGSDSAQIPRQVSCLKKHGDWVDALVLIAREILRTADMAKHAHDLEEANASLAHQAVLGRYMLEMRHTLNNALTSVLGNSELLLLEPGIFPAVPRSQIETLRNMAMRIHEILQRFSSLDKECGLLDVQTQRETGRTSRSVAASL